MVGSEPEHPGDPGPDGFTADAISTIFSQSPQSIEDTDGENGKQIGIHVSPMLLKAAAKLLFLT